MATNKPRIPVTMEPELFEQVSEYRRRHGITSQSKAIQQLVRIGIGSLESARESNGTEPEPRNPQERELLQILRELGPSQKALLLRVLELAGESEETRRSP